MMMLFEHAIYFYQQNRDSQTDSYISWYLIVDLIIYYNVCKITQLPFFNYFFLIELVIMDVDVLGLFLYFAVGRICVHENVD